MSGTARRIAGSHRNSRPLGHLVRSPRMACSELSATTSIRIPLARRPTAPRSFAGFVACRGTGSEVTPYRRQVLLHACRRQIWSVQGIVHAVSIHRFVQQLKDTMCGSVSSSHRMLRGLKFPANFTGFACVLVRSATPHFHCPRAYPPSPSLLGMASSSSFSANFSAGSSSLPENPAIH